MLEELDDLGGGFRLAAHDLEIRGAGNLLGKEQSGNVTAVGFELYAQMLEETVTELRGGRITVQIEPEIQLGIPAYIPEAYIPDVNQRLVFYKRLANVEARDELEELGEELEDRFGPLPELVLSLIEVMDLRRVLRACLVTAVSKRAESVTIHFHPDSPIKPERLVAFIEHDKRPCAADARPASQPGTQAGRGCHPVGQDALARPGRVVLAQGRLACARPRETDDDEETRLCICRPGHRNNRAG